MLAKIRKVELPSVPDDDAVIVKYGGGTTAAVEEKMMAEYLQAAHVQEVVDILLELDNTSSRHYSIAIRRALSPPRSPARRLRRSARRFRSHIAYCPRTRVWLTYLYLAKRERFSSARENDSDVAVPAARPQGRGWGE